MKGIGLYGGTFNPVHLGHLRVAEDVRSQFGLDKIVFIPSAIPPHKDAGEIADIDARYAMLLEALSGFSGFTASDAEMHRQGPSYTIDTLSYFQARLPEETACYLIVGLDAFLEITTWKDWPVLFDRVPFIVMTRPGTSAIRMDDPLAELADYLHAQVDPSYRYAQELRCFIHKAKHPVFLADVTPMNISSSDIRKRVREGKTICHLVPAGVADYIKQKKLYKRIV